MGPRIKLTNTSGLFDPPPFTPDDDLEVWRKRVGLGVEVLSVSLDKGSDRTLEMIFRLLGRNLYNGGLPDAQKDNVDEAQVKGQTDYL